VKKSSLIANLKSKDFQKFLTYAICYIGLGIGVSSLGPLLPFLADNVSVSLGVISFAFTAQNLGYLLGSVGGGWLFDRFKSHTLMILSLCLMIAMGVLIPFMNWFSLLLVILFLLGLGLGALDVGANVSLVWIYQSRVGPFINALHFSFGLGGFLSPIIISSMMAITDGNLMWAIWALVLLFFPGLIGLLRLRSPENPGKAVESANQHIPVNYRMLTLLILLAFLFVGVQIGFGGLLFTYVSDLGIADATAAALMTSIFWGCITVGRLIAIPVSKKVQPAVMLLFNCALTVIVMGLILIWPMRAWMLWVGSAGLGLAISSIFPTTISFTETKMTMTGRVTGLLFLGSSLGMMLLPMLLGQVFEYIGGYEMMLTLFVASLLGLSVMILIIKGRFKEITTGQQA
jgi:FHS family Na+ dependent glucose MFS transporter 1